MFILCFDFGINNIGIAIGQFYTRTASPIVSLKACNGIPVNWKFIKDLIKDWSIKKIVIGYPKMSYYKNFNNNLFIKYINKFVIILKKKFKLKVFFSDENYTSYAARNFIKTKNMFYNLFYSNKSIHSISAVYILESWLKINK